MRLALIPQPLPPTGEGEQAPRPAGEGFGVRAYLKGIGSNGENNFDILDSRPHPLLTAFDSPLRCCGEGLRGGEVDVPIQNCFS